MAEKKKAQKSVRKSLQEGYEASAEDNRQFAEKALPLFLEVIKEQESEEE